MNYCELLKTYIKNSGLTLEEISTRLKNYGYKVSKGYISQLQNGKTDNPATPELNRALADITGGDVECLLTAALIEKAPAEIKGKFERLVTLKKLKEDYIATHAVEENAPEFDGSNQTKVPVLTSIAAGQPIDRIEYIESLEYVNKSVIRSGKAFALEVKDDSMIGDNIIVGDIVICIQQKTVSPTDIAIVAVNKDKAGLKRIKIQGEMCLLMPSNPKIQPMIVKTSDIEVIGKVVELRRRF